MRPSSTLSPRLHRRSAVAALVAMALLAAGCVTRGHYNEVVGKLQDDKAALQSRVRDLERSNKALDQERVNLVNQLEDLRQTRESLESDVAKLQKTKDLLTENLRSREAQLGELTKLRSTYEGLVKDLEAEVSAGQIQIEQLREGLLLNLSQDILFPSGSIQIEPSGQAVLKKVATQLRKASYNVEVQGHTDNVPLSPALARRFGTNWELAAARAAQVVRLLESDGVDPHRLSVVSFGEWAPVASNDTPEGRARNRRIEIRLVPVEAPVEGPETSKAPS